MKAGGGRSRYTLPVYNSLLMAVLYGGHDLSELGASLLLLHLAVGDEIVEHFATGRVLHHQVERLFRFDHLKQLHDVRMIEHFHYPHLQKGKRTPTAEGDDERCVD